MAATSYGHEVTQYINNRTFTQVDFVLAKKRKLRFTENHVSDSLPVKVLKCWGSVFVHGRPAFDCGAQLEYTDVAL